MNTKEQWDEKYLNIILGELDKCLDADVDRSQIVCSEEYIAKMFYKALEQAKKEEVRRFMEEMQKRADTYQ